MENSSQTMIVIALFIGAFVFIVLAFQPDTKVENLTQVKICSWNLDNFGVIKSSNLQTMEAIKDRIKTCDIFFVSNIEDSSGISFNYLCQKLPDYQCYNSSIQGGLIKQQYGIFWRKFDIFTIDYSYLNFTYPPIYTRIYLKNYSLDIYYFRTNLENVNNELDNLKNLVPNSGNTILMGDFHNDCLYSNYNFDKFSSIVQSNCTYERIYINENTMVYFNSSGIDYNFTSDISNNYISWIKLNL